MMETEEHSLSFLKQGTHEQSMLVEVINGLSQHQKTLPAKFLYDQRGSEIFEEICRLPSYYPTRTETKILREHAFEMLNLMGEDPVIVEPGSGAAEKVRILFRGMEGRRRFVPIEISREILLRTCHELLDEFPDMELFPVCADFTKELVIPLSLKQERGKKVVFFPGSTIGNLDPFEAEGFLRKISELIGHGGGLLIGVDRKKDTEILRLAYNDPEGVTAEFNLNLLDHINHELDATFVKENFRHEAIYNEEEGRIEMHLISLLPQIVRVHENMFRFQEGESIHTENSYKYSVAEFTALGEQAGLSLRHWWEDSQGLFSVYYFENNEAP